MNSLQWEAMYGGFNKLPCSTSIYPWPETGTNFNERDQNFQHIPVSNDNVPCKPIMLPGMEHGHKQSLRRDRPAYLYLRL